MAGELKNKRSKFTWGAVVLFSSLGVFGNVTESVASSLNYGDVRGSAVDLVDGFVYIWTKSAPVHLLKVNLRNFKREGALSFNAEHGRVTFCVIDPLRTYAYFGTEGAPAKIIKVQLSNLTHAGILTLAAGENNIVSGVIDMADNSNTPGYAYFGTNTSPGRIVKVDLAQFERVGAIVLGNQQNNARPAVIDIQKGVAYFGASGDLLSQVVELNLSDFTIKKSLTLQPGENGLRSAFLDTKTGSAYFGANGGRRVIEVRVSDLTRRGHLDLFVGNDLQSLGLINTNFVKDILKKYNVVDTFVKMNFAELKKVDQVNINLGNSGLPTALLDLVGGFGYFGMESEPGNVTQFSISDLSTLSLTADQGNLVPSVDELVVAGWANTSGENGLSLVATSGQSPPVQPGVLEMNTEYSLKIKIWDGNANSDYLSLGSVMTLASMPGLTVGVMGINTLGLAIDPRGNPIGTWYDVEKKLEGEDYALLLSTTSVALTVGGLTPGSNPHFRVRAKNKINSYTDFTSAISAVLSPSVPSHVRMVEVTENRVAIAWMPSVGANEYTLFASQSAEDPTQGEQLSTGALSGTVDRLKPNTTYYLFLQAANVGGRSEYLSVGSTTTLAARPQLRVALSGLNFIALIIDPSGNPLGTLYEIMKTDMEGTFVFALSTTSLNPTVDGLLPGTQYQFQIRAKNLAGSYTAYALPIPAETVKTTINSVGSARAYPVPFRPGGGHDSITFDQIPADSLIQIYSQSGLLLKEIRAGVESISWNAKNESGENVASGVYFVRVSGSGGEKTFNIVVER
jgi:hypothetical protein